MNTYKYKAKDNAGNLIKGEVEGSSEVIAARLVRDRGYILIELKQANQLAQLVENFSSRVPKSDVVAFTRQLATMVNAGLPITEALSILRIQSKPGIKSVISQVLADVEGGESLSTAISRHPKVFSQTFVALIKAGEAGGVLDKVLERLADNLEKQQEFKGKVRGAMIYPALIVAGMIAVSVVMIVFIVPRLTDLFDQFGKELPLTTRLLIGLSDFIINFWYLVILIIGVVSWGFIVWSKTKSGKKKISELLFKIPVFGDLMRQIVLTEITRTLALMQGAGVPIIEAITVTSNVVSNVVIKDAMTDVAKKIEKGFPTSYAFSQHPEAFPYLLSQMVSVGEETGKMEEVLSKVAHVFEVESDQKVKTLTSLIEPLIMIVLGLGVAFLVISIIMPIYDLTSSF